MWSCGRRIRRRGSAACMRTPALRPRVGKPTCRRANARAPAEVSSRFRICSTHGTRSGGHPAGWPGCFSSWGSRSPSRGDGGPKWGGACPRWGDGCPKPGDGCPKWGGASPSCGCDGPDWGGDGPERGKGAPVWGMRAPPSRRADCRAPAKGPDCCTGPTGRRCLRRQGEPGMRAWHLRPASPPKGQRLPYEGRFLPQQGRPSPQERFPSVN